MSNYDLNIERGILSAIIFDNSVFGDIESVLKPNHFYTKFHRDLFATFIEMYKKEIPLSEDFISKIMKDKFDEESMIEIISTNPITNYKAYIKELKEMAQKRELNKLALNIQADINNLESVEVLNNLEKKLNSLKEVSRDTKNLSFLRDLNVKKEDLNKEVEHLIKGLLVKNTLNMYFAMGGKGKSLLALSIAIKVLKEERVNEVFYLDMDNSIIALKNRNLEDLMDKTPGLNYIHKIKIDSPKKLLKDMANVALADKESFKDKLVVIDSIRDFLGGSDINHDTQVIPILDNLKLLREAGATVIFLHHISKGGVESKQSKGATAFRDSVDCSYYVDSNRIDNNNRSYTLTNDKDRIGFAENLAFELNVPNLTLNLGDYDIATMDKKEMELVAKVKEILTKTPGIKQIELLKELDKVGDKNIVEFLKKFTDTFWIVQKGDKNANIYFLIKEKRIDNGTLITYS